MRYFVGNGEMDGGDYFLSATQAAKLLGTSRRTFYEYLRRVKYDPAIDRKRVGLDVLYSEPLISRMWIYCRRTEKYSAYPNNRGAKGLERQKELGLK